MPKYSIDLEKSLELQNEISHHLTKICDETEYCCNCKYSKSCSFNIQLSVLLRQAIKKKENF